MFSEVLRRLRNSSGLSQEELAKRLGLGKSTISMYESGMREPSFEILEAIADTFNVDMNTLIGKSDYRTNIATNSVSDLMQVQLINNYNQLNESGKAKLLDYSNDLVNTGNYIISNQEEKTPKSIFVK